MDVDGTLTDGSMYYSSEGEALKKFSVYDGMGITLLHKYGIQTAFITSKDSKIAQKRAEVLNVQHIYIGCWEKEAALKEISQKMNISTDEIAYIGDDVNDLEALKLAGFSAVPANAIEPLKKVVDYVCNSKGGEGAVREICEMILDVREL